MQRQAYVLQIEGDTHSPSTVATIGGRNSRPSGIGDVTWSWQDDNGKTHRYELKDVYYFTQSPVNILSVTTFAKHLNDEEGTGIDTKASYSCRCIGITTSTVVDLYTQIQTYLKCPSMVW
jgi:hypothetical protein